MGGTVERRRRMRELLVCPGCRGALEDRGSEIACVQCRATYRWSGIGVPSFRRETDPAAETAYLEGWQGWLRRRPTLYAWVFRLFSPVLVTGPDLGRDLALRLKPDELLLDLGPGNDRRHDRFVNLDILAYPEVDVLAEADALPFEDGSVGGILSIAVLEHLEDPLRVLAEARRVLRPGGELVLAVPFLQPFHAAPHDYRRWTRIGLEDELGRAGFRIEESGVYAGPSSALAWMVAGWWTHVLSLGSTALRAGLSPLLQAAFSWIKWPDLLLARLPGADEVASVIWVRAVRSLEPPVRTRAAVPGHRGAGRRPEPAS